MVLSSQSGCIPFALKGKNNGDQDDIKQVVLNLDSPRDLPEKQEKKESSPPDLPLESEKTGVEDIVEQIRAVKQDDTTPGLQQEFYARMKKVGQ